jgi:hypothetical protein
VKTLFVSVGNLEEMLVLPLFDQADCDGRQHPQVSLDLTRILE